jgi:glycosyltransferase involved in cell wall biosynthesis
MRILHLLNHTRRLNGHVHAAIDLSCAQVKLGHQVAIASGGGDFDEFLPVHAVETMLLDHERKPLTLLKAVWHLRTLVRHWRPDVVHAHMVTSAVVAWPVCKMFRIPLVTTVHNEFQKSSRLMGIGTRVIAVSAAVGRSMQKRGISAARLDVVLNGTIGSARFEGKDRTPRPLVSPAIIFLGGLHPRKGLPDLFAAFELVYVRNSLARLYIVGGGPFLEKYIEIVSSLLCAKAVTFMGDQDDPFPLLLGADVFVLPSHADPAPLVLSEAREAGCAIVATNVDGIPEMLEQGKAGILVPARDPIALSQAIIALIDEPNTLLAWKGNSQFNLAYLEIARVARETLKVYGRAADQVAGHPGRRRRAI